MVPESEEDWKNYQRLKSAIRHGHVGVANHLIQNGVLINVGGLTSYGYHSLTPLHLAVQHGSLDQIKSLLDRGSCVYAGDDFFETPLMLSVRLRKFAVTDLLLTADDLVESQHSFDPIKHLHIACLRNNMTVIKKLIAQGGDVNKAVQHESLHWSGYTPLHFAVENHSIDVVEILLKSGASMMKKNDKLLTPLHLADIVRDEAIIDILLEAQLFEPGNAEDDSGLSHFHIACTRNNKVIVEYFLKQGVDINLPISEKSSRWKNFVPIMFAIYYECPDVVELLLQHGANFTNLHTSNDEDSLGLAYKIGNQKIIDLLVNNRTVKNKIVPVRRELSDFKLACVKGDIRGIKKLVHRAQHGASELNTFLWNGWTPLHYMVRSYSEEMMDYFQYLSGSISVKDSRGRTPLHIFFEYCYDKPERHSIPSSLIDFERNPSDFDGLTHLHIACTTNQVDWIENFLKNGADVDCAVGTTSLKWSGYTPLHFAVKYCQSQVVDVLLNNGARISLKNGIGLSPFDTAVLSLNSRDITDECFWVMIWKMLLENETSNNDFDKRGFNLLHVVCSTKFMLNPDELAHYIDTLPGGIDQAIDYPASKYHKFTALHFAGKSGNNDIAKWLIGEGADIHLKNHDGYSPLQHEFDSPEDYGILRNNPGLLRVPGNPFDFRGYSYFHRACILGDRESMDYYLSSGVDINLRTRIDRHGRISAKTALHLVVNETRENVTDTVKYLIDNGADVMALDAYQNTPLHCMIDHRFNKAAAQLLVDRGADVNAQNFLGETPLHNACERSGNLKKINFLIGNGADINVENTRAETPLTHECKMLIDGEDANGKIILTLLKHVKKLMIIGMHVSTRNLKMYSRILKRHTFSTFQEFEIKKKCLEEIQLMKSRSVNKCTTVYDIVFSTPNHMTRLIPNSSLRKLIHSDDLSVSFPMYGYLIKLQVRRGLRRKPLLEKCEKIFNWMANLSVELTEKILDYLEDFELRNIIASVEIVRDL
ncbi:hypothetical protein QAD02_005114 [Eretmocerus hayati]|uniref:Uncharacterized protein n=1 Tax=Eretmocerus hayati TaxID=131215 RepID=A0ACC2NRX5_9HYME|nr:hypothetical protein QAD02_005114 [Eretmocerus hayati]